MKSCVSIWKRASKIFSGCIAAAMLCACGGGGGTGDTGDAGMRRFALAAGQPAMDAQVVNLSKLSETRVNRTTYDYVFKVTVQIANVPLSNFSATIVSVGAGSSIVDATASAPFVAANSTIELADTVTIRHDRSKPFDLAAITWVYSSQTISGRVIDDYLRNAIVFHDCNGNLRHDPDEVSVFSTAGGNYRISLRPSDACKLLSQPNEATVDEFGGFAVRSPLTMAAMDTNLSVITPFTTLASLGSVPEADIRAATGLNGPLDADYLSPAQLNFADAARARILALALQTNDDLLRTAGSTERGALFKNVVLPALPRTTYDGFVSGNRSKQELDAIANAQPFKLSGGLTGSGYALVLDTAKVAELCADASGGVSGNICRQRQAFVAGAAVAARNSKAINDEGVDWAQVKKIAPESLANHNILPTNPQLDALNSQLAARAINVQQKIREQGRNFERGIYLETLSFVQKETLDVAMFGIGALTFGKSELLSKPAKKLLNGTKTLEDIKKIQKTIKKFQNVIVGIECIDALLPQYEKLASTEALTPDAKAEAATAIVGCMVSALGKSKDDGKLTLGDLVKIYGAGVDALYAGNLADIRRAGDQRELAEATVAWLDLSIALFEGARVPHVLLLPLKGYSLWKTAFVRKLDLDANINVYEDAFNTMTDQLTENALRQIKDSEQPLRLAAKIGPWLVPAALQGFAAKSGTCPSNGPSVAQQGTSSPGGGPIKLSGLTVCVQPFAAIDGQNPEGTGTKFSWSFGDGVSTPESGSTGPVQHKFPAAGTYRVSLVTTALTVDSLAQTGGERYTGTRWIDIEVSDDTPTQVFRDDFPGTALSTSSWTPFGTGAVSVANGTMNTACRSWASTQGKVTFSGSKIVIEGRMAGLGSFRESSFMLVDSATGEIIQAGETNYQGQGLYAYGTGSFALPQTGNGSSVGGFQEFRLTLDGTSLKLERGTSLSGALQSITRTLGSPVAGRTFYLIMGTGGSDYCPGSYDWVQVTATSVNVQPAAPSNFPTTCKGQSTVLGGWTSFGTSTYNAVTNTYSVGDTIFSDSGDADGDCNQVASWTPGGANIQDNDFLVYNRSTTGDIDFSAEACISPSPRSGHSIGLFVADPEFTGLPQSGHNPFTAQMVMFGTSWALPGQLYYSVGSTGPAIRVTNAVLTAQGYCGTYRMTKVGNVYKAYFNGTLLGSGEGSAVAIVPVVIAYDGTITMAPTVKFSN